MPTRWTARLMPRWTALVADAPREAAEAAGHDLVQRYGEEHRRYHDERHLAEVLDAVDALAVHAGDPDTVRLAAWFHDAVYRPDAEPGRNEEDSARLAESVLPRLGQPAGLTAAVAALVRGTAHHEVRPDAPADAAVLYDADLAILGSSPDRYAEYAADVRAEFAFVPDDAFRAGRAAILRSFADRPRIYVTPTAYAAWESAARTNLAGELRRLSGGG